MLGMFAASSQALVALAEELFELFMPHQAWIWDKTGMTRKLLCCNQGKLDIKDNILGERAWTYCREMILYGKCLYGQVYTSYTKNPRKQLIDTEAK